MTERYQKLLDLINIFEPQTIVETGTWNGHNAIRMIQAASRLHDTVQYIGYDLFEYANDHTDAAEFNVKPHFSMAAVESEIKSACPGAEVALIRGNTNDTLAGVTADFAFIDGGHSIETIAHDFEALKSSSVIVFDDFYKPDETGAMPDVSKLGCNRIVESLPHTVIETSDRVKGGGFVNLAVVFGNG